MKNKDANQIILIGYAGHAYVVADIFIQSGNSILGYCEKEEKKMNPFHLKFLGLQTDSSAKKWMKLHSSFIAIGDNEIRKKIHLSICNDFEIAQALHPSALIATHVEIGNGTMVAAGSIINSCTTIGNGVIINTGSIIEHECNIADFVHVAPGAVLCGNVKVGGSSFIGLML